MTFLSAVLLIAAPADAMMTAVTISPVHLSLPVLEATVEGALAEKLSAAVIAGGGRSGGSPVWEAGGQGRWFFRGGFGSNLHLAAEALYIGSRASSEDVTASASSLSVGPLLGAKWTADVGFVAELQAGPAYNFLSATGSGYGTTTTESSSGLYPNVNINLGWSF